MLALAEDIDAHRDAAYEPFPGARPLAEQIRDADVVDGVAFMSLADTKVAKRGMGRPKDLDDVRRIEERAESQDAG